MSTYGEGFRNGALAERRRCILIALRTTNLAGNPCAQGHNIAHDISDAGEILPVLIGPPPFGYTSHGQRRLRDVPTALEEKEGPFTQRGKKYMSDLQLRLDIMGPPHSNLSKRIRDIEKLEKIIVKLQTELDEEKKCSSDLEAICHSLTQQNKGVIR